MAEEESEEKEYRWETGYEKTWYDCQVKLLFMFNVDILLLPFLFSIPMEIQILHFTLIQQSNQYIFIAGKRSRRMIMDYWKHLSQILFIMLRENVNWKENRVLD